MSQQSHFSSTTNRESSSSSEAGAGNASSFEHALDRMIDSSFGAGAAASGSAATATATATSSSNPPKFISAASWQGTKPGYYFGTSTSQNITGYYWDDRAASQSSPSEQLAEAGATGKSNQPKNTRKRVMIAEDKNEVQFIAANNKKHAATTTSKQTGEELLQQAEEAVDEHLKVMELTPRGVQQAIVSLKRATERNSLERAKYQNQPEQYMDSELALHEGISSLQAVAAQPDQLYKSVLSRGAVPILAGLLSHENSDIAMGVIHVLVEWLDPSLLLSTSASSNAQSQDTFRDVFQELAQAVLEQCLDMIVANLGRMGGDLENDEQDMAGVQDILTLVENILELDALIGGVFDESDGAFTSVASKILNDTLFLSWILPHATDATSPLQGRAAELASFLLQHEDASACVQDIGDLPPYQSVFENGNDELNEPQRKKAKSDKNNRIDGMELLLQSVARWRKKHPSDETECELLENLCLALASLLFQPKNVQRFLDGQGIELILRCLKEKIHAGGATLKVLDFMGTGTHPVYQTACEQLVEAGGLKLIFPIFMGRSIPKPAPCSDAGKAFNSNSKSNNSHKNSKRSHKKWQHARKEWLQGLEDNAIRIMYSLTRHIQQTSPHDAFQRMLVKFVEADCEKCDRLVELLLKFDERSRMSEYSFYYRNSHNEEEGDPDELSEQQVELAASGAKLKGGGDLFHRVGAICAFCCVGSKRCHEHILTQLTLQKSGVGIIKVALEDFAKMLGDGDQKEQLQTQLTLV